MAAPAPLRRWRSILCTDDGVRWPWCRVYPPATPAGRWRIPKAARQLGGGRLAAPRRPAGRRASDGTLRARAGKLTTLCAAVNAVVPLIASAASVLAPCAPTAATGGTRLAGSLSRAASVECSTSASQVGAAPVFWEPAPCRFACAPPLTPSACPHPLLAGWPPLCSSRRRWRRARAAVKTLSSVAAANQRRHALGRGTCKPREAGFDAARPQAAAGGDPRRWSILHVARGDLRRAGQRPPHRPGAFPGPAGAGPGSPGPGTKCIPAVAACRGRCRRSGARDRRRWPPAASRGGSCNWLQVGWWSDELFEFWKRYGVV